MNIKGAESPDIDNEEFGSPPPEFLDPNANLPNDNDAYRLVSSVTVCCSQFWLVVFFRDNQSNRLKLNNYHNIIYLLTTL